MGPGRIFLSSFLDGFTLRGLTERMRPPGAPTRVFAEEPVAASEAESEVKLIKSESFDLKKYLAYLMIAKSMNRIQSLENLDTGRTSLYLVTKDEKGRENELIELGKDFAAALENANLKSYDALRSTVENALHSEYEERLKREKLLVGVNAQVDEVRAARKDTRDETYREYVYAANVASTQLKSKTTCSDHR
jgi:hypothetical protein